MQVPCDLLKRVSFFGKQQEWETEPVGHGFESLARQQTVERRDATQAVGGAPAGEHILRALDVIHDVGVQVGAEGQLPPVAHTWPAAPAALVQTVPPFARTSITEPPDLDLPTDQVARCVADWAGDRFALVRSGTDLLLAPRSLPARWAQAAEELAEPVRRRVVVPGLVAPRTPGVTPIPATAAPAPRPWHGDCDANLLPVSTSQAGPCPQGE